MATNMRRLESRTLSDNAHRSITGSDSAAADNATFLDTHSSIVYGAGTLYVMAAHDNASGSISGHMLFYDRAGNLIAMGPEITLAATAIQATIKNSSGTGATRNLSAAEIEVPTGGYTARFYVTTVTTSTNVDIFIAHDDGFSR